MTYRPLTVESALEAEREAREQGFDELADHFKVIADTLARVNETHRVTVEEARQNMGEEAFWNEVRKHVDS